MSRKRNRQTDETTTPKLNPLANDFKSALDVSNKFVIPIEHVFKTNINYYHEPNTNRYHFEYPGSWRTITNQQLLIGIRAVYLKFTFIREISFTLVYYNPTNTDIYEFKEFFTMEPSNPLQMIQNINTRINRLFENKINKLTDVVFLALDSNSYMTTFLYISHDQTNHYVELKNFSNDFKKVYGIKEDKISFKEFKLGDKFPEFMLSEVIVNNEFEITASFVNQTENQHLGYTGITFNPMKYYKVNSSDTGFYIDLWSKDGLNPVELIDNKKDSIVIEAVLTTTPLK